MAKPSTSRLCEGFLFGLEVLHQPGAERALNLRREESKGVDPKFKRCLDTVLSFILTRTPVVTVCQVTILVVLVSVFQISREARFDCIYAFISVYL